jgi:hypothetical protein
LQSVTSTSAGGLPGFTTREAMPLSATEILPASGAESNLSTVGIGSVAGLTAQLPPGPAAWELAVLAGPAVGELGEHPAIVNATIIVRSISLAIFMRLPLSPRLERRFQRQVGA